jgi:N-acetylmuramoyl-L-alanine amidase
LDSISANSAVLTSVTAFSTNKKVGLYIVNIFDKSTKNSFYGLRKGREDILLKKTRMMIIYTLIFFFLIEIGILKLGAENRAYAYWSAVGNVQLLARAINGEARGEPYLGQVAVGAVILNRTRDSRFPKTIAGVIYQPGAFTAVSDGQINVALDPNSTVVRAARDALNGFDPTHGCVYYYNPATATSSWIWGRRIVTKIGLHNFAK